MTWMIWCGPDLGVWDLLHISFPIGCKSLNQQQFPPWSCFTGSWSHTKDVRFETMFYLWPAVILFHKWIYSMLHILSACVCSAPSKNEWKWTLHVIILYKGQKHMQFGSMYSLSNSFMLLLLHALKLETPPWIPPLIHSIWMDNNNARYLDN